MFVASCSVGWFISSPILPFVGFVKCNLNAAIFAKQMRVGFGFAIRDNNGGFVVAGSGWLVEYYLPSLAELLGLKQVLQWLIDQDFSKLIVMLLYNKEGTSLSWVPRQANNLAHANEALLFMHIFLFG
ncbi:hypothetical protein GH714_004490 [Hevea brasiliensis]|uniref:RNase H type-1 domain-containing protein n=1 Tax=Hevea brasiliensis TaxID=3981 RepID=A0A6A6MYW3_HEVBR|nr:hypothetical protein GH714_004490 [Hevea brasiliensis]